MAYVYLLGDSGQDNTFKIGMTRGNINKRIKQLQTGNGENIYLVNYYETDYPFFIERLLHTKFYPKQKKNEWFNLNIDDVVDFKMYCENFEKQAEALKDNPFSKNILK
jgi:hypothetical protein